MFKIVKEKKSPYIWHVIDADTKEFVGCYPSDDYEIVTDEEFSSAVAARVVIAEHYIRAISGATLSRDSILETKYELDDQISALNNKIEYMREQAVRLFNK